MGDHEGVMRRRSGRMSSLNIYAGNSWNMEWWEEGVTISLKPNSFFKLASSQMVNEKTFS
jgi:hypothetical protein